MASLTGNKVQDTYKGLIKTQDNAEVNVEKNLTDGDGNLIPMTVSQTAVGFTGDVKDSQGNTGTVGQVLSITVNGVEWDSAASSVSADGVTILDSSGVFSVGTIAIANTSGLQAALDGKVDDGQVLTSVPAGAVFTDTQLTQEQVEDYIAGLLVAGGNIDLNYDDVANTLTINAENTTYTAGDGLTLTGTTLDVDSTVVRTTGTQSVGGDKTFSNNVVINGDLTVSGTTTTINTNELDIGDNIITLNSDETGAPTQDAGMEIERGTSANVLIRWNETTDRWEFTNDGTNYSNIPTAADLTAAGSDNYVDGMAFTTANGELRLTRTGVLSDIVVDLDGRYLESYTETDPVFTASPAGGIVSGDITNWNTAHGWGDHSAAGYLTSYTETDPVFTASPASVITLSNIANWHTAYNWGDHAGAGYLTSYTETDPVFSASAAGSITSTQVTNWDTAYGWGDHSSAGYLTSLGTAVVDADFSANGIMTRTGAGTYSTITDNSANWDTAFGWGDHSSAGYLTSLGTAIVDADFSFNGLMKRTAAGTYTTISDNSSLWDNAFSWGDHSLAGYLTGYTETDPVFSASAAGSITSTQVTNWDTAFGWGDHSAEGYLTDLGTAIVDGDFTANGLMKRTAAGTYTSVTDNSTNWDTAYGWGDHSAANYLTEVPNAGIGAGTYGNVADGTKIDTITVDAKGRVTAVATGPVADNSRTDEEIMDLVATVVHTNPSHTDIITAHDDANNKVTFVNGLAFFREAVVQSTAGDHTVTETTSKVSFSNGAIIQVYEDTGSGLIQVDTKVNIDTTSQTAKIYLPVGNFEICIQGYRAV